MTAEGRNPGRGGSTHPESLYFSVRVPCLLGSKLTCLTLLFLVPVGKVKNPPTVLKAPNRCAQLFDRKHFLITYKQTELLGCIPCVVVILLSTHKQTNGRTLPKVLSTLLRGR